MDHRAGHLKAASDGGRATKDVFRTHTELPRCWNERGCQVSRNRALRNLAECGRQQGSIDVARALERFGVDGDVDQGIEPTDRANVARFGPESTPGPWPGY